MISISKAWIACWFVIFLCAASAQVRIAGTDIDVEEILRKRDLLTVIAEAEKAAKTDIASLYFRLDLYSRAANGPKMSATLDQIIAAAESSGNPSQELSRAVPFAKDPLVTDARVLRRLLNSQFDSDVFGRLINVCTAAPTTCDEDEIDHWLGQKADNEPLADTDAYMDRNGRWEWISRRIDWRRRTGGDVSGITTQFADAVRNDPTNLNAALRFVRFAGSPQDVSWLAEIFSSDRAYDYFELGTRLSNDSCCFLMPETDRKLVKVEASKLLAKSLDLPFTPNDVRLMGSYRLSRASVQPQIGNYEKQLRYWTKKELANVYLKIGMAQAAQRLVEELTSTDMSDILADSVSQLAGVSQMGSGARVVESKILAEQAAKQDTYRYWLERIAYYRGRKEPVQVFDSYAQALKLVPTNFSNRSSMDDRMWFVSRFVEFATDSDFGMGRVEVSNIDTLRKQFRKDAEAFLAEEFERSKRYPTYAVEVLAVIREEDFDDLLKKLLPQYPSVILAASRNNPTAGASVARPYFESDAIDQSKKDALFMELLRIAATMDVRDAWSLCEMLIDLDQPHQIRRIIPILTKHFASMKGRRGRVGDGIYWSDITERYSEVIFGAYVRGNDWSSAEVFLAANPSRRIYSPYDRLALAAARSGAIDDALRFWKIRANLNRRSLDYLSSYRQYPQFADSLRGYYRQMKVQEPYSPVPDLALKALN